MRRLDTIFDVRYGHSLELNALTQVEAPDGVNFVSRAMGNNGVTARVAVDVAPASAGTISVALGGNGVLSSFVQPEPFVCGRDVAVLNPKQSSMPLTEKLWWCRVIWENRYRFSYGRQANRTLGSLLVPDQAPKWVYKARIPSLAGLAKSSGPALVLGDPGEWREFRLEALFTITKGSRVTKADRTPGTTRFIGASERQNGITDLSDLEPLYPAGVLTVSYNGSVGQAFYQDQPFWPSDDINVLTPKVPMTKWVQLFIASVIRHERTRYTYGYKWTLERMSSTTIRLPARTDGTPDLDFMESYMKGLPFSASVA